MPEIAQPAAKVLVLEDEGLIAMMIEGTLAEAGYEPATAATVKEALDLLGTTDFGAAVLDVGLREGNSFAVADVLMERKVPFVFCTASSVPITAPFLDVPVLAKPFTEAALLQAVGQALELG